MGNGSREGRGLRALDEREDAATKAGAHDARAKTSVDGPRLFGDRVHAGRRHLEIVAEADVRFPEKGAHPCEVAVLERVDERAHARHLRVDMLAPPGMSPLRLA